MRDWSACKFCKYSFSRLGYTGRLLNLLCQICEYLTNISWFQIKGNVPVKCFKYSTHFSAIPELWYIVICIHTETLNTAILLLKWLQIQQTDKQPDSSTRHDYVNEIRELGYLSNPVHTSAALQQDIHWVLLVFLCLNWTWSEVSNQSRYQVLIGTYQQHIPRERIVNSKLIWRWCITHQPKGVSSGLEPRLSLAAL